MIFRCFDCGARVDVMGSCRCPDGPTDGAVPGVDYEPSTCPVCGDGSPHDHTAAEYDAALGTWPREDDE